jgi:hypothetical protein
MVFIWAALRQQPMAFKNPAIFHVYDPFAEESLEE